MPVNNNIKKVLVAPLDWGLGHATRCIPIINALVLNGFEVLIAAEGAQANLLRLEFPGLSIIPLEGYRVRYSRQPAWLPFVLLWQLPRLIKVIRRENRWLQDIIREYTIDLVISDNRYGLYTKKVPCIFITHQLRIKAPFEWLENMLQRINYRYINRYTACWVPDAAGTINAAGILAHPQKLPGVPVHYIGLLSRFQYQPSDIKYDYCILLSGPEPQRTLFEKKLLNQLADCNERILLVRGKPGIKEVITTPKHITVENHLPNTALQAALLQSNYIISRSGYTTVMELLLLHKKAILVPTPGQTEQEYLAQKLKEDHISFTITQNELDCGVHFEQAKAFAFQIADIPAFEPKKITLLISTSINHLI